MLLTPLRYAHHRCHGAVGSGGNGVAGVVLRLSGLTRTPHALSLTRAAVSSGVSHSQRRSFAASAASQKASLSPEQEKERILKLREEALKEWEAAEVAKKEQLRAMRRKKSFAEVLADPALQFHVSEKAPIRMYRNTWLAKGYADPCYWSVLRVAWPSPSKPDQRLRAWGILTWRGEPRTRHVVEIPEKSLNIVGWRYIKDGQTNALDPSRHPDFKPKDAGPYAPSPYEHRIAHCVPKFPPLPPTKDERRQAYHERKAAEAAAKEEVQRKAAEEGIKSLGDALADFDAPPAAAAGEKTAASSSSKSSKKSRESPSRATSTKTTVTTTMTTTTTTKTLKSETGGSAPSAAAAAAAADTPSTPSSASHGTPSEKSEFVSNLLNDYQKSTSQSQSQSSQSSAPNSDDTTEASSSIEWPSEEAKGSSASSPSAPPPNSGEPETPSREPREDSCSSSSSSSRPEAGEEQGRGLLKKVSGWFSGKKE